jgi:hypothetical protein
MEKEKLPAPAMRKRQKRFNAMKLENPVVRIKLFLVPEKCKGK